jgi:hypothetical protein
MARPPGEPVSPASAPAPTKGRSEIPSELKTALHTTIGAVLDFILETFACSPEDKVTSSNINSDSQSIRSNAFFRDSQNIKMTLSNAIRPSVFSQASEERDEDVTMMDLDESETAAEEAKPSSSSEVYACILWNDESHSYPQVIDQLVSAARCTEAQAKATAENVNLYVSFDDAIHTLLAVIYCHLTLSCVYAREETLLNCQLIWMSSSTLPPRCLQSAWQ